MWFDILTYENINTQSLPSLSVFIQKKIDTDSTPYLFSENQFSTNSILINKSKLRMNIEKYEKILHIVHLLLQIISDIIDIIM